eukprot:1127634-Amphidinium_carterae.6
MTTSQAVIERDHDRVNEVGVQQVTITTIPESTQIQLCKLWRYCGKGACKKLSLPNANKTRHQVLLGGSARSSIATRCMFR